MSDLFLRHFERHLEKFQRQDKKVHNSKYLYSDNAVKTYAKRLYSMAKEIGALKEKHPREVFNGKYNLQKYVDTLPSKYSGYTVRTTCSAINHYAKICGHQSIKPPSVSCPSAAGYRGYAPNLIKIIEEKFQKFGEKYQVALRFAVESGCRLEEIKTVRIAEKDLYQQKGEGYHVAVKKGEAYLSGKGGRIRPVPSACSKETLSKALKFTGHFPKEKTLRNRLYEVLKDLGIHEKGNGFHGFRHSWARERMRDGWSRSEISQALGHDRESITNAYLK